MSVTRLVAAAKAVPDAPDSASKDRKAAHDELRLAVKAAGGPVPAPELRGLVDKQPLVGVNRAAKILGIAPPNFKRYRDRLTEIPVEGSAAVFVKAEVEELAEELADGRRAG